MVEAQGLLMAVEWDSGRCYAYSAGTEPRQRLHQCLAGPHLRHALVVGVAVAQVIYHLAAPARDFTVAHSPA